MIDDYTPGFQDYLNNITEKNPAVDRDYIKTAIRDAIGFIKEQDAQIRTIRGQMNKARREARALQGEDEDATV